MPIAIRAGQRLEQTRLEPAAIAGPLRRDMRRCRSRQPRQTLPQPRRGPAADHERHSIGRRLGRLRGDLGARRPRRPGCRSNVRRSRVSRPSSARLPPTHCRTAISPQRCCSAACRPGRTFFIACVSTISARAASQARRRSGTSAPRPRREAPVSFAWSGDTTGQGWGIDESRGGMRTYRTMLDNRPDFFIHSGDHIYADCPVERELKLPDGGVWRNIVTEEKSVVAHSLAEFRGNYKYNWLDPELSRLPCRRPPVRAMGRS